MGSQQAGGTHEFSITVPAKPAQYTQTQQEQAVRARIDQFIAAKHKNHQYSDNRGKAGLYYTQSGIAAMIGYSYVTVIRFLNGENVHGHADIAAALAKWLDDWEMGIRAPKKKKREPRCENPGNRM